MQLVWEQACAFLEGHGAAVDRTAGTLVTKVGK